MPHISSPVEQQKALLSLWLLCRVTVPFAWGLSTAIALAEQGEKNAPALYPAAWQIWGT